MGLFRKQDNAVAVTRPARPAIKDAHSAPVAAQPASPPVPRPRAMGVAVARGEIAGVLGELLRIGKINPDRAEQVQQEAERAGRMPFEVLLKRSIVSRGDLYAALEVQPAALQRQINFMVRSGTDLPEWSSVLNDVGGPLGSSHREPGVIAVAADEDVAEAKRAGEKPRCFLLSTREAIATAAYTALVSRIIRGGYEIRARLTLADQQVADVVWAQWDERRGAVNASSVRGGESDMQKLFDHIGPEAYALNASDIHIIAKGGVGSILYRIDGDIIRQPYELTGADAIRLCSSIYDTLTETSSVKEGFNVGSLLDGSVDRSYDDCRLRFRFAGGPVEPNGYRVAMRVIPIGTHARPKTLAQLGYAISQQVQIDRAFSRSSGLVLFSGTTGSGKSTTMSHRLSTLCRERPTKAVLTVEEPVEYIIAGAHQSSVKRQEGEDGQNAFQRALRGIMRQDPDVLMVGEIRDLQTADMALQGVRSGHLLISTLHAGAAPTCYDRLAGLGILRGDLATMDLVAGFVFQALVQTLCGHCKIPAREMERKSDDATAGTIRRLHYVLDRQVVPGAATSGDPLDGIFFRNPSGCDHCSGRGITGRTVCAEVFQPTPEMLLPIRNGDSRAVWELWRAQINKSDPDDMTGRRAIEHAMWKMGPAGGGVVSPLEVESQFRLLDEPIFRDGE